MMPDEAEPVQALVWPNSEVVALHKVVAAEQAVVERAVAAVEHMVAAVAVATAAAEGRDWPVVEAQQSQVENAAGQVLVGSTWRVEAAPPAVEPEVLALEWRCLVLWERCSTDLMIGHKSRGLASVPSPLQALMPGAEGDQRAYAEFPAWSSHQTPLV